MTSRDSFRDRAEAGRVLAGHLAEYAGRDNVLVLALPRGGVPVAFEVARALDAPLDVFVVRKLGVPGHEELAMGAIASGGMRVLNSDVVRELDIPRDAIDQAALRELTELERREQEYRGDRPPPDVRGRTVILIDDGLATGSTMRAAALALRQLGPAQIVVAVPVAAVEACDEFRDEVERVVCALTPRPFRAVGLWYEDFSQTTDQEVRDLLARSAAADPHASPASGRARLGDRRGRIAQFREIPIGQWPSFLGQFSRAHHGQAADVETTHPATGPVSQAQGLRLLGVTTEQRPGEGQRIDVMAGDPSGRHVRSSVPSPVRVRVAEWNDAVSAELQIESDDGRRTCVHVGPREQTLAPDVVTDGLWERD